MQPELIYCYDAYCGWCYSFSPVVKKIAQEYSSKLHTEVLSGGMILPDHPAHIKTMAGFIKEAYKTVEERTGIKFGNDFLWHIFNADESDWYPSSEKPAIALCIFKEKYPNLQIEFASDLQYALNFEGRDLTDDEAYRHLLNKYVMDTDDFYSKLKSEEYKEKAYYEFQLCKQLQVTGFPQLLLRATETKFHLLAKGFTDYETLSRRLQLVLSEIENNSFN